jgi:hypothetical protein
MADLRDGEERDDTGHGNVLAQLAKASDEDLEEIGIDPDDLTDTIAEDDTDA